jgi:hypothetical protein
LYDIVVAGFPGTIIAVSVEVSEKDEDKVEWLDMAAKVRRGVYVIQKTAKIPVPDSEQNLGENSVQNQITSPANFDMPL